MILGLDAGNTKTIALVAREDGTILGAGRAGCGDIYGLPAAEALANVERAIADALSQAGGRREALAAAACSMAGADWPEDYAYLRAALERLGLSCPLRIVNDALGALRAGAADGTGVAVVCGTGAAIGARAPDGRAWHMSHWGETGGAGHLGAKALRAVYRAALAIGPPTALAAPVLAAFGEPDVERLLHRCTAREAAPMDPARLARVLLDVAAAGDPTAAHLVREHGASLGDYALAAARMVDLLAQPFSLVLAGGVFRHPSPLLAEALTARVLEQAPGARATAGRFEPVVGAVLLALDLAGMPTGAALLERLAASLPPPALFAT